ncbi:hypothetical protein FJV76_14210 [Mesorhizobium sp. WSM4303]|uniref:hypothetical protein n=1 Tax=Mesorhizobium sp. WSM4303 TaxID=2589887 RepID=UPI00115F3859|nr:hypothetical protein [Mesorhizobium sp. WSM4303]TRD03787.1 hypothetical protein FJV76_14210 [Mesorhizobium sp. WSM4303]
MRLPIDPTTCTVLGYKPKNADDPLWAGLEMSRAELRNWADYHLAVPWEHPDDQARFKDDPKDWAIYRVRPAMEPGKKWKGKKVQSVGLVHADGAWWIDVEFASRPTPPAPAEAPDTAPSLQDRQ